MTLTSCSTLPIPALVPKNLPIDPGILFGQRRGHAFRLPFPVGSETNVGSTQAELPCNSAEQPPIQLRAVEDGIHIIGQANNGTRSSVCLDGRKVKDTYTAVKKNVSNLSRRERLGEIALKLKGLKRVTGLKQKHLAEVCGVSRVQVSRWEHSLDLPSAKALLAISELATGEERQWWRDCAAERTGLGSAGNTTLEIFEPAASGVTIPLISNPKRVGSLGTLSASDVELQFSLPHSWFQDGGAIQAAKINATSISPLIEGEVIAIIDASQKDPDRLVGCTVAIQTVNGIEIRKLLRDRKTYILLPLEGHGSVNLWRPSGENSIAGKVVRWISQPRG